MESIFQFSNPVLLKLDFKVNDRFEYNDNREVQLQLMVETQVNRQEHENQAFVILDVRAGQKEESFPFYIHAQEAARFMWESALYDEEKIDNLLKQNAPALLLSYLRPIIANVTGSSPYSAYHLPFMNFVENK